MPYITRTDNNNGIDGFIPEQSSKYRVDEGNVITIGLDTQTVFYQPTAFYTGQNIQVIRHPQLDKYNAMFLIVAIQKLVERFSWGSYGATLSRLRKSRIYLPANEQGKPDFAFMSSFMQDIEHDILDTTLCYFADKQQITPPYTNDLINWQAFYIRDVFNEIQRGKRLKTEHHIQGNMPYVSSTANNNGVDNFIANTIGVRIFEECLTLANSGSVGTAFYQPFAFVASDHVTQLKRHDANKYIYLYLASIISRLSEKYSFNREINDKRILREQIFLPTTPDNQPNWEYMETYMRNLESRHILTALRHYASHCPRDTWHLR